MTVRTFALVFGIVFLIVGIAGFIPALSTPHVATEGLAADHGGGLLFGLFAVNTLHNIVHLAFGVWGLAVYRSFLGSVTYARSVAIVYALLTVFGLIPGLNTVFGLVPLYGHDVWLHVVLAAIGAYFGFVRSREPVAPATHRV